MINLSVQACMNANDMINDAAVGAALNYAVVTKDVVVVAAAGNTDDAKKLASVATQKLDKAASKKVIHKNQAANRKSAMAKRYAEMAQAS